jgi:hypothetical protein
MVKNRSHFFISFALIIVQSILTQVVLLLVSLFLPGTDNALANYPVRYILLIGFIYAFSIYLPGWLVIRLHWLDLEPLLLDRLVWTIIGAFFPLVVAYFLITPFGPNLFFVISILTGVIGFYIPGWWKKEIQV